MRNYIILSIILILLSSCATFKPNYAPNVKDWENFQPDNTLALSHSMFLFGDGGNAKYGEKLPLTDIVKRKLAEADENSSAIFLGDNIYPDGMPSKHEKQQRNISEHKLDVQIEMLENFKGEIMWIMGNHDWYNYGLKGVKRQEKYIEKKINRIRGVDDKDDKEWKNYVFPGNGCGDPYVMELDDNLVVVLIDSQWWLQDWDTDHEINEGCEIKSREDFAFTLENVLKKHRNKNCVLAMHHPIYSNGPHGGYYSSRQHLFPFSQLNKKLLIPLPGIGSIFSLIRGNLGIPQDISNSKYKDMTSDVLAGLTKNGNFIIASGHEHNLQYIDKDRQHFIVSGSASKENASRVGNGGEFGYGRLGYSRVDFYEDGSAWVNFMALNEAETDVELMFRKKIKDKFKIDENTIPDSFPVYESNKKEIISKPSKNEFGKIGFMHKAILGEHYSDIYAKEYPFEVMDMSTHKGGLVPIKRGGGNQTNSLRLRSANGQEYVMRSLTKDASRVLPYPINKILGAKSVMEDNFMAAHPFAALAVPKMAEAANIYHTNPKLYYIPKQPALGIHNGDFGNDVYLFEERAGGNWDTLSTFGFSSKIISTLDVVEKLAEDRDYSVDQNWVVRSRLFDILIRDWDRHEDQWRWATLKNKKEKFFRPIPRDRDQAFAKYDGALNHLVHAVNPFMRQLQTYDENINNIKWVNWNAKYFDKSFTSQMTWDDWKMEAEYIKDHVTDDIIDEAFRDMPLEAQNEEWEYLIETTKLRRDKIVEFAKMAYEYNNKKVDILGTAERDLFKVERLSDEQTQLKVFRLGNKGKKHEKVYDRIFDHDVTKEIHLYAMEDDDEVKIKGNVNKSLKVRIIGGTGEDLVEDESSVKKGGKKTLVYDSNEEKNEFYLAEEGKDKTSNKVVENTYVRKSHHYDADYVIPLPLLSYTPDDGLIIGADISYIHYSFKKFPYGQKHRFSTEYATSPNSLMFHYRGEFIEAVKKWDLLPSLRYNGNRFSFNYFGYGNETVNEDPDDLVFNRVRQSKLKGQLLLSKRILAENGKFSFGPYIEQTEIDNTENRFLYMNNSLPADIFDQRLYLGAKIQFDYESIDERVNPHKGIVFKSAYSFESSINPDGLDFGRFDLNLTIYQPLDNNNRFVIATKAGYAGIKGSYDFFKAPSVGGNSSLRGYRFERFYGDKTFYHSSDMRIKLLNSIKSIPFTIGVIGSFDYGRVWVDDQDSNKWHNNYGYGLWVAPIDFIVLSFGSYVSDEDTRFLFSVGHLF